MDNSIKKVCLVEGLRTPFTKAGKEFSKLHPSSLAARNLQELLFRQKQPDIKIDEVIIGNVANLPDAANIARVISLQAGLPESTSAMTVHRNCASSLESVATATAKLQAGMLQTAIAGGVESMSQIPFLFSYGMQNLIHEIMTTRSLSQKLKKLLKFRLKFLKPRWGLLEALTDPFTGINMGETAEVLAKEFQISREDQDELAFQSHKKACYAEKKLQEEIVPVFVDPDYKMVSKDTGPRSQMNKEKVSKMPAYFDRRYGTVTVANSCPINDGSAMLLLMREDQARSMQLQPLVKIRSLAFSGLDPRRMGLGPAYATPLALKQAGLSLKDIGLVEINEAFAAQVLACLQALGSREFCTKHLGLSEAVGEIDTGILNVNGGAIALGHPVSATGARMILTLAKEMKRRQVQFGLATLCIGGGQGGACILENIT